LLITGFLENKKLGQIRFKRIEVCLRLKYVLKKMQQKKSLLVSVFRFTKGVVLNRPASVNLEEVVIKD
jgi:hypothetical protein